VFDTLYKGSDQHMVNHVLGLVNEHNPSNLSEGLIVISPWLVGAGAGVLSLSCAYAISGLKEKLTLVS